MTATLRRARPADVGRLSLGLLLLARPALADDLTGTADGREVRVVARVLGARYVAQAVAGLVVHEAWLRPADAAVDVVHAASMLVLARRHPAHRRVALASAALATGFAVLDVTERT